MSRKKIVIMVVLMIIVLAVMLLGVTIRKMIILKNLENRVAQYIDDDNHYEKIINDSDSTTTVTEYYCKGDKALLSLNTTVKATGEVRKLTKYFEGNKENSYFESGENKVAIVNQNQGYPVSKIMIIGLNFDDNLWALFQMALTTSIKSVEWNGKECYLLNGGWAKDTYIEKKTGLILKRADGTVTNENANSSDIIVEYSYEFGKVKDEDFAQPDISEYKIEEN